MSADYTRQSQYFASLWARHYSRSQVPGRRSLARVAIALLIAVTGVWTTISFRDSAIAGASSPTPSNGVCPVVTASQWRMPYRRTRRGRNMTSRSRDTAVQRRTPTSRRSWPTR